MAANPSIQLGTDGNWAIKEDNLLAYKKDGTRFFNKEFDFTRGSFATFVDKDGLIKVSGLQATNLVNNGNFSELGSELITNGDFSNWTNDNPDGWTITGTENENNYITEYQGKARYVSDGSTLFMYQNVLTTGKFYKITADIVVNSGGGMRFQLGANGTHHVFTTTQSIVLYAQQDGTDGNLQIIRQGATDFTIDNVSVKQVDPNNYWTLGTGWSFGDNKAVFSGVDFASLQPSSSLLTIGKTYKISLTATITNGSFKVQHPSSSDLILESESGSYSTIFVATSNTFSIARASVGVQNDFTITNISIQEIQTDLPRIDFSDTVKGALLLEPQSTNLVTYSEDFSDSSWSLYGTIQANSSSSPDGLTNATKLTHTHQTYNMLRVSVGGLRVTSVFVKNIDANNFYIRKSGGGYAYYNFDTKTVNDNSLKVEYFSNDWVRLSLATDQVPYRQFGIGQREIDLSEVGNSVYVWGAQLEALSYATSYIPTFGSTATRNAESCNNSGSAQDFNDSEGVLYCEIAALHDDSTNRKIAIGSSTNRIIFGYRNGLSKVRAEIISSNSVVYDNTQTINNITTFNKFALKYKQNDFSLWINSQKVSIDTSGNTPTGLNELAFDDGSANFFYGKTKNLKVFKRAMSDGELYLLTVTQYQSYQEMATALNYTL